jgi:UDP-glucose 4-epimerase
VSAVLLAVEQSKERINIFNLGTDEYVTVNQSVSWITETLSVKPELTYEGGTRGWVGDNPFILLDTTRIRALGWRATLSIHEAVVRTVEYLRANQHLLHRDRR